MGGIFLSVFLRLMEDFNPSGKSVHASFCGDDGLLLTTNKPDYGSFGSYRIPYDLFYS